MQANIEAKKHTGKQTSSQADRHTSLVLGTFSAEKGGTSQRNVINTSAIPNPE